MNEKLISFYFDESEVRAELERFAQSDGGTLLFSKQNGSPWTGDLPSRVDDYFYDSEWILLRKTTVGVPGLDVSLFSADRFKTPEQAGNSLGTLAAFSEWAVFPWGGYAKYGMLGVISHADEISRFDSQPIFRYPANLAFDHQYRGVLGRRTRTEFGPSLWNAINGASIPPIVITFEYYEEAFEDVKLSFKVEGTFAQPEGPPRVSAYRMLDFETFKYFAGNANQFGVFDVLPGTLDFDSCAHARLAASGRDVPGTLKHSPWYLVYNGGEIDTNHALFFSLDHRTAVHFVDESRDILEFVSYF